MYKNKDRETKALFKELLPFGGQLDESNRWLRIAKLIPWGALEDEYGSHFSHTGRPATDGRLFLGLILLKHMTGLSDRELIEEVLENLYMQRFCGFEQFVTRRMLDASTLTKLRKKLGLEFFKKMEEETYRLLIERKIIKGRGILVDATVFPENIKYPNDVGLLNKAREWMVRKIKTFAKVVGKKPRTYQRNARKVFLGFSKKKTKSRKVIQKAKKQMLQYAGRNLRQMHELIGDLKRKGIAIKRAIRERLQVVAKVIEQQWTMYRQKSHRVADRIVSLHRSYVRPIVRGKTGKEVEFGPKAALSHVGGFMFVDHFAHDSFAEADKRIVRQQIKTFEKCFGRKPASLTGDRAYGNRDNREMVEKIGLRGAFQPLGRKAKKEHDPNRWFKRKQRERNRIEGGIGHGKEHFELDCIRYEGRAGSEMWVRLGVLGMNLKTAMKKA